MKASRPWITRFGHTLVAIALGVAATGFLVGTRPQRQAEPGKTFDASTLIVHPATPAAVRYEQMGEANLHANSQWTNHVDKLVKPEPDLFAPVSTDPQAKRDARAQRAAHRAYDGAPPVIPHTVTQRTASSCLACHENGMRVGDRTAPVMSHAYYQSCTQCHVESENQQFRDTFALDWVDNTFEGLPAPAGGERAWPGAPPVMPHKTHMRENCMSCHGTLGREGMRTSHPWRNSCSQCHAESASLDQRPEAPAPWELSPQE